MKKTIIIAILLLFKSNTAISQNENGNNVIFNDTIENKKQVTVNKSYSISSFQKQISDTLYYDDKKIKSIISNYQNKSSNLKSTKSLPENKYLIVKKILQYDKCGNLRSITITKRYDGIISSCWDPNFNDKIEETLIKDIKCNETWKKQLFFY